MSAYGGVGYETNRFLATLIDKVSEKRDMHRSIVANYIRTKLSFHLVRSQIRCLRGARKIYRPPNINVEELEVVQAESGIRV